MSKSLYRFLTLILCLGSVMPTAAQSVCQTPGATEFTQCFDNPQYNKNLAYRANTNQIVTANAQNPAYSAAVYPYIQQRINLTGKIGARLAEDSHYSHLFGLALGTVLTVNKPFDIYLLMGQSNMVGATESLFVAPGYYGPDPEIQAALQTLSNNLTQAVGAPSRTVVTFNCAVSGTQIYKWDPKPSADYGNPSCLTRQEAANNCTCDPQVPASCSCLLTNYKLCSDGVSFFSPDTLASYNGEWFGPSARTLVGTGLDQHNYTRHCLEAAQGLKNSKGESGKIAGMFFYQGESDAGSEATVATWANSYKNIVAEVRAAAGAQIPVVNAQIHGPSNKIFPAPWRHMQAVQASVVNDIPNAAYVCSSDLTIWDTFYLNVHLNDASQAIMGARFADAYIRLLFGFPPNPVGDCAPPL